MVYLIKETHFLFLWSDCKTSQVPSSIVYSAAVVEPMRIARANNNPESFSTAIKPLIALMSRQWESIGKINSFILKFLTNMS